MIEPAVKLAGVRVDLGGQPVLLGIDLEVAPGELVALVGASGGGKSTILRAIHRLCELSAGTIHVLGAELRDGPAHLWRRRIGHVVQRGGLFPHWDVLANAAAALELAGWPRASRLARAREALAQAGLDPAVFGKRRPSELSGGQIQRVALARALAPSPKVLLLDEPFGALDPITRRRVRHSLAPVLRGAGAATLLVTHDLREAFELCDRVAVVEDGRLSQVAPPARLRAAPATPFVAELCEDL